MRFWEIFIIQRGHLSLGFGYFGGFWRPLDFEGVPNVSIFWKNQHKMRKMISKKGVWNNMSFRLVFDAKMGGLTLQKKGLRITIVTI